LGAATIPLMLLAALLGALVAELIPAPDIPAKVSFLGIVLVALVGTFLPVPMAFDVAASFVLMVGGVPMPYVATLLCTLGAFSVYPLLILLAERFPGAPLSSFLQPLCCWGLLPEPLQPSHNTVCSFLPRIAGLARPALGISLLFGFSRPPGSHPRPPGALPPRGTDIVSARPGLLRPQPAAIRHSLARCWKTARCHSEEPAAAGSSESLFSSGFCKRNSSLRFPPGSSLLPRHFYCPYFLCFSEPSFSPSPLPTSVLLISILSITARPKLSGPPLGSCASSKRMESA